MANPKYDELAPEVVKAARTWLELIGYAMDDEHSSRTPQRLSWYVQEVLTEHWQDVHISMYPNDNPRVEDMVVVDDIPIWSACSHHLLPFFGVADFGYVPGENILGLSKIPQVVQSMAKAPWVQEHMTHAIADYLYKTSGAMGVIVRTECTHTCMMLDLNCGRVPSMTICALRGVFAYNPAAETKFLKHISIRKKGRS